MKIDNKPTVQNIKIDTLQVTDGGKNIIQSITGDNNSAMSVTNDNTTKYKQDNITQDVKIDSNTSNKTQQLPKKSRKKFGAIVGAIATFCTISGFSVVSVYNYVSNGNNNGSASNIAEGSETNDLSVASDPSETGKQSETIDSSNVDELYTESGSCSKDLMSVSNTTLETTGSSSDSTFEEYKVFLYSEYSKITIYGENNMTATLNFEADEVSITAYLASGKVDTLTMNRKNLSEWGKKVVFNETGIHKIEAAALAPDGRIIVGVTEIEVIPINLNDYNFDHLF